MSELVSGNSQAAGKVSSTEDGFRKLIIQIPCYNEAGTLAIALADLPRQVTGYDVVEWLVIDDGCTDDTVKVALENGVDHIVSLRRNQGLANGFMAGIEACLKLGAHTIVNTDADNQYKASHIPDLVMPILSGEADYVVGERPIVKHPHFSPIKKMLQSLGSWAVRKASGTSVPDAPSGFRAIHREAAMQINVFNPYTYTLETIIQAGRKKLRVASVPVGVNGDLRPSRLVKSMSSYIKRSIGTIFRYYIIYTPIKAFSVLAALFLIPALGLGIRYMWLAYHGHGDGNIQSLILLSVLATAGFLSLLLGVVGDLMAINRRILEENRTRLLRLEIAMAGEKPLPSN